MKNWKTAAKGKTFAASYSGGKDSTLALYKAMTQGRPAALLSMLRSQDGLVGAHGVSKKVLQAQADSMGIPLLTFTTDWENYGPSLISCIQQAKKLGAQVLVTGDLELPEENCWYETITQQAGVDFCAPLWQDSRQQAVEEFLSLGFVSKIVSVDLSQGMKETDLGRILTPQVTEELLQRGIDCCGEGGEFHSIVLDGPIFQHPIQVRETSRYSLKTNLCLELEVCS